MKFDFRNAFIFISFFIAIFMFAITDPDMSIVTALPFGASTVAMLTQIFTVFVWIPLLHITRKAMMPYDSADFDTLCKVARRTPEGAGSAAVAVALMTMAYALIIAAVVIGTFLSGAI